MASQVERFKFDEGAGSVTVDQAGNNTGTFSGTVSFDTSVPTTSFVDRFSLAFNVGAVSASDSKLPSGSSSRTLALWFKTTQNLTNGNAVYMAFYGTVAASQSVFVGLITNSSLAGSPVNQMVVTTNGSAVTTTGLTLNNGAWHHVAVTFNGTTWTIFIDGVSKASGTMTTNTVLNALGFSFSSGYIGNIDDFRVFDYVVAGTDIASLAAGNDPFALKTRGNLTLLGAG